jgi:hypothetical protein
MGEIGLLVIALLRRFLLSLRPSKISGTPVASSSSDAGSGTGALMAAT